MSTALKSTDPLVGKVIAERYAVIRLIGKGGMGNVYEVSHKRLGRRFAMKTLSVADDAEAQQRFRREADVINKLRHPNIVDVVDWDMLDDGSPYMIMELLEGEDLSTRIARGPMEWSEVLRIADQVLGALSVTHRANIVHRDLKPANIFLAVDPNTGEERVKLLDFGVSKVQNSQTIVTADTRMLGTPSYMSPEQADGRTDAIAPATDTWATGAILYEMATGHKAFHAASVPSILYKICYGEPEPVATYRPDAPEAFCNLVDRTLSRSPDQRIIDADRLRWSLRASLELAAGDMFLEPLTMDSLRPLRPAPAPPSAPSDPSLYRSTDIDLPALPASAVTSDSDESIVLEPPRRSLLPMAAGAGFLGAAGLVAVLLLGGSSKPSPAAVPAPPPSPSPPVAAKPQPTPVVHKPAPAAVATPPTQTITITIESQPPGATVQKKMTGYTLTLNEKTPVAHKVELNSSVVDTYVVSKPGYVTQEVQISRTKSQTRTVVLEANAPTRPAAKRARTPIKRSPKPRIVKQPPPVVTAPPAVKTPPPPPVKPPPVRKPVKTRTKPKQSINARKPKVFDPFK